jgi:hypothetical protein
MNRRRLLVVTCVVMLLAVVLLAGISHWSDTMAGEKNAFYAADGSSFPATPTRDSLPAASIWLN